MTMTNKELATAIEVAMSAKYDHSMEAGKTDSVLWDQHLRALLAVQLARATAKIEVDSARWGGRPPNVSEVPF